jgi:perosamine synthetase
MFRPALACKNVPPIPMKHSVSRRKFLSGAAAAGAGLCLTVPKTSSGQSTAPVRPARAKPTDWPVWDQREEKALLDVLNSGKWGRGNGERVKEFEAAFAAKMRAKHCVATASGTTALLATLGALDVGPGDEVILPPYTFVATFNVITANYALPVFVDTDPATFQIDPKKIAAALTPNTRVLLPVHIGGYVADMDGILAIARERKLAVIEDACQAWFAEWRGQPVGTHGNAGCFSFQASKNLTAGEGGAVITNDEEFATKVHNFHTPSGARSSSPTGRGANFRLTEFQAALLLAQMTRLDEQFKQREANAAHLTAQLQKIPGISPARFADGATRSAYHLYMVRYDKRRFADLPRAKFLQALGKEGVGASGGYSPLNTSAHVKAIATNRHYQRIYGKDTMARWVERNRCPVNDRLCEEAFWFSQSKLLGSRSDMDRIAEAIAGVQKRAGDLARA